MATDLFNNISNDYIYPELNPCPDGTGPNGPSGTAGNFEFLPNEQVGIVSGSDIISAMGLSDISQPVSGWTQQSRVLEPGEVTFIPGLTKGIQYQTQVFLFDPSGDLYSETASYTDLAIDLSINYYRNFRHYDVNIQAEADAVNGIDIDTALDIEFAANNILINTTYDASGITFTGANLGYQIDITNVKGSLVSDPSTSEFLTLDASISLPAFKYRNTAMLGYVLKVTYPPSTTTAASSEYVEINHVPDYLEYFELDADSSCANCYERFYKSVDVGLSAKNYSDTSTMSAGEYLDYVDSHDKWEKVGSVRIWLTAPDAANSLEKNLIPGFYVFNPQSFAVQISYMVII